MHWSRGYEYESENRSLAVIKGPVLRLIYTRCSRVHSGSTESIETRNFLFFWNNAPVHCIESTLVHLVWTGLRISVSGLGDFFKALGDKVSHKNWQSIGWLFGLVWKTSLWCKNWWGHFWGKFWKNWATFYFNIWSHCTASCYFRAKITLSRQELVREVLSSRRRPSRRIWWRHRRRNSPDRRNPRRNRLANSWIESIIYPWNIISASNMLVFGLILKVAHGQIWTTNLLLRKPPLCQLCHMHYPIVKLCSENDLGSKKLFQGTV